MGVYEDTKKFLAGLDEKRATTGGKPSKAVTPSGKGTTTSAGTADTDGAEWLKKRTRLPTLAELNRIDTFQDPRSAPLPGSSYNPGDGWLAARNSPASAVAPKAAPAIMDSRLGGNMSAPKMIGPTQRDKGVTPVFGAASAAPAMPKKMGPSQDEKGITTFPKDTRSAWEKFVDKTFEKQVSKRANEMAIKGVVDSPFGLQTNDTIDSYSDLVEAKNPAEKETAKVKLLAAQNVAVDRSTADTEKGWIGKSFNAGMQSNQSGIDNAASLLANAFGDSEVGRNLKNTAAASTYKTQKMQEQAAATTKNQGVNENFGNAVSGIGQMANSVMLGAVNPFLGAAVMGGSAFGNYGNEALTEGASQKDAIIYGAIGGALEFGTDLVFNKILGVMLPGAGLDGVVKTFTKNATKNMFKILKGMAYAGLENFVSEGGIDPALAAAKGIYNPDVFKNGWFGEGKIFDGKQMLSDAIAGGLTGVFFGGGAAMTAMPSAIKTAQKIQQNAPGLIQIALGLPPESDSAILATELLTNQEGGKQMTAGDLDSLAALVQKDLPNFFQPAADQMTITPEGTITAANPLKGENAPVDVASLSAEDITTLLARPEMKANTLPIEQHNLKRELTAALTKKTQETVTKEVAKAPPYPIKVQQEKIADLQQRTEMYGEDNVAELATETKKLADMQLTNDIKSQQAIVDDLTQQVEQYGDPVAQQQLGKETDRLSKLQNTRATLYEKERVALQAVNDSEQTAYEKAQEQQKKVADEQATAVEKARKQTEADQQKQAKDRLSQEADAEKAKQQDQKTRADTAKARSIAADSIMPQLIQLEQDRRYAAVNNVQSMEEWNAHEPLALENAENVTPADIYRSLRFGTLSVAQEQAIQDAIQSPLSPAQEAAVQKQDYAPAENRVDTQPTEFDYEVTGESAGPTVTNVDGIVGKQTPVDRGPSAHTFTERPRVEAPAKKSVGADADGKDSHGPRNRADNQTKQNSDKERNKGTADATSGVDTNNKSEQKPASTNKDQVTLDDIAKRHKLDTMGTVDTSKDTEGQAAIRDIMTRLGMRTVFFDSAPGFNGVYTADRRNTVFVSNSKEAVETDKNAAMLWAAGHEFCHSLAQSNPDLYKKLLTYIGNEISEEQLFAYYTNFMKDSGAYSKDKTLKEMISDTMGNFFMKPAFWDTMAKAKPALFERLVSVVRSYFKKLFSTTYVVETGVYDLQVAAMQKRFEKIVVEARKKIAKAEKSPTYNVENESVATDGKLMAPPIDSFSVQHMPQYEVDWRNYATKIGVPKSAQDTTIANWRFAQQILMGRPDLLASEGIYKFRDAQNSPVRSNTNYGVSGDMNAECPRSFGQSAIATILRQQLGRPLYKNEALALVEYLRNTSSSNGAYTCLYCYVESARRLYGEYLNSFSNMKTLYFGFLDKHNGAVPPAIARALLNGNKALNDTQKDRVAIWKSQWVAAKAKGESFELLDLGVFESVATEDAARLDPKIAAEIDEYQNYANAASSRNKPKAYSPYAGQIQTIKQGILDLYDDDGGVRALSSTDYQPAHTLDFIQFYTDLMLRKAKSHNYTKEPTFVEIFHGNHAKKNMSIAAAMFKGKVIEDGMEGMAWEAAQRLSKLDPDAGSMLMGTTEETINFALETDWVWMCIPYHSSGESTAVSRSRGWQNFTSQQNEGVLSDKPLTQMASSEFNFLKGKYYVTDLKGLKGVATATEMAKYNAMLKAAESEAKLVDRPIAERRRAYFQKAYPKQLEYSECLDTLKEKYQTTNASEMTNNIKAALSPRITAEDIALFNSEAITPGQKKALQSKYKFDKAGQLKSAIDAIRKRTKFVVLSDATEYQRLLVLSNAEEDVLGDMKIHIRQGVFIPKDYSKYSKLKGEARNQAILKDMKDAYLAHCKEMGLFPKFPHFMEHPGYMKLITQYTRWDSPQIAVTDKYDKKRADEVITEWQQRGGDFQRDVNNKENIAAAKMFKRVLDGDEDAMAIAGQVVASRLKTVTKLPSSADIEARAASGIVMPGDEDVEESPDSFSKRDLSVVTPPKFTYNIGDKAPNLTLKPDGSVAYAGDRPENYRPKKLGYAYKLMEQWPDGTLHPLFAGARKSFAVGPWNYAEGFVDEGTELMDLRDRYGWHMGVGSPSTHHLMGVGDMVNPKPGYPSKDVLHPKGSKRVWTRVAFDASNDYSSVADQTKNKDIRGLVPFGGYYMFQETNLSNWIIASGMKFDKVLTEQERQAILKLAGVDEVVEWQKKTLPRKLKGELTRLENVINKTTNPEKRAALVARKNTIQKVFDSNPHRGWTEAKMGKAEGAAARVESRRAVSDAVVDSFSKRTRDIEAAFKDSKVRNKDGSLMEVYHGTGAERIDAFDMSRGGQRTYAKSAKLAFFFTDNYSVAETYRDGNYDTTSVQSYIDALTAEELEAVADSNFSQMFGGFEDDADINYKWTKENFMTLVTTLDRGEDLDGFRSFVKGMERTWKKHIPQPESWERVKKSYEKGYGSVMKFYLNMTNPYEVQVDDGFEEGLFLDSIVKAKELGHDGVIFRNADDAILPWDSKDSIMSDVFAVFKNTQIKSEEGTNPVDTNNPDIRFSQRAYHGSPHDHDGFTTRKIGSGEGHQAYGWGLYFASDKSVAEWYRKSLSKGQSSLYDGKPITPTISRAFNLAEQVTSASGAQATIAEFLAKYPTMLKDHLCALKNTEERYAERESYVRRMEEQSPADDLPRQLDNMNYFKKGEIADENARWAKTKGAHTVLSALDPNKFSRPGKLYTVELAPEDDAYLDWDNTLADQPKIRDLIKNELVPTVGDWKGVAGEEMFRYASSPIGSLQLTVAPGEWDTFDVTDASGFPLIKASTWDEAIEFADGQIEIFRKKYSKLNEAQRGKDIYRAFTAAKDSPKAASEYLASIGIPGIRYLDGVSRGKGKGNSNYVVFEDKDVSIKEKFSNRESTYTKDGIPEKGGIHRRGYSTNTATNTNMHIDLQRAFTLNPMLYKQLVNADTLSKANERVATIVNHEQAYDDFLKDLGKLDPSDVPYGAILANYFAGKGDKFRSEGIVAAIAEKMTEAGRWTQAAVILRDTGNADFMLRALWNQIKKLNAQGTKLYGAKWVDILIIPAEENLLRATVVNGTVDQAAWDSVLEDIHKRISKEIPTTAVEKFNSFRRMAMLLNPKTHLRNVIGNMLMKLNATAKDINAVALETLFIRDKNLRTHALNWKDNPTRVKTTIDAWNAIRADMLGEHKYDVDTLSAFHREKRIFKNKQLEALNKWSSKLLDAGDIPFMRSSFMRALGMEMKARRITAPTQEMINRAHDRALEDTFKMMNGFSDMIRGGKRKGGFLGHFLEALIPFEKTPAAIAWLGVQYSPLGVIEAGVNTVKAVGSKDVMVREESAKQAIEGFAKVSTGVELMALGMGLVVMGLATGARKEVGKEKALLKDIGGVQAFTIKIGKWSYTMDWAQPALIPFAMGATLMAALSKNEEFDAAMFWDASLMSLDSLFGLTMLRNLQNTMGSANTNFAESVASVGLDYFEQAIPSMFGIAARSIDPVRRVTRGDGFFKDVVHGWMAKTPGLSLLLEADTDVLGREKRQNSVGGRDDYSKIGNAALQLLSPGYLMVAPNDSVDIELMRIWESTKDKDSLPREAPKSITDNYVEYPLSTAERMQYQRDMGQMTYKALAALYQTSRYKNAESDNVRADLMKTVMANNAKVSRAQFLNVRKAMSLK